MDPVKEAKKRAVKFEKSGQKIRLADGCEFDLMRIKESSCKRLDIEALRKLINE